MTPPKHPTPRDVPPIDWPNLTDEALEELRTLVEAERPEHAADKQRLAKHLPKIDAPDAPARNAYDFDLATYSWKPRATSPANHSTDATLDSFRGRSR